MRLCIACLASLLLAAAIVACGVRSPLTDDLLFARADAASDAPGADAHDAAPADSGAPDAPVDAPPDVALPAADLGNVFLSTGAYLNGDADVFVASGAFFADVTATGCDVRALGSGCTLETCQPSGAPVYSSAGTIAVLGGSVPVIMQQGPGGDYNAAGYTPLWLGGETMTVTAGGGDVPPFTARVLAPSQVVYAFALPLNIARAAPFALQWSGASAGKLTFDLSATSTPTRQYLECTFDVSAQHGAVPAAVLSQLPAGATGTLTISTQVEADVHAGPWLVKTFAQSVASDPGGNECSGIVTLQ